LSQKNVGSRWTEKWFVRSLMTAIAEKALPDLCSGQLNFYLFGGRF
jgi:hypothetical protein